MKKVKSPIPVEKMVEFHEELTSLLKKYDLHGDVDHIELKTPMASIVAHGIINCNPACVVYGPYIGPDGKKKVGYYCAC